MIDTATCEGAVSELRVMRHAMIKMMGRVDISPLNKEYYGGQMVAFELALTLMGSRYHCPECDSIFFDATCPCKAGERL